MKSLRCDLQCAASEIKTWNTEYHYYTANSYKKDDKAAMIYKSLKRLEEAMREMKNIITDYQEGKYE